MKVVVIHGSPSGKNSTTLQYIKFIQQRFPIHEFEIIDVGRGARKLERSADRLDAICEKMAAADCVVWSFPVYTFLAPAGLVRFIELLFDRLPAKALLGTITTTLTTSEHFFDHTAHAYMEGICEDLGMSVVKGFSAEMEEILVEKGRRNLTAFFRHFFRIVEESTPLEVHHEPLVWKPSPYQPKLSEPRRKTGGLHVTLITDITEDDGNSERMIEVFCHHSAHEVDVLNLREIGMKGGCMGCLRCVYDGTCVIKDGFADTFDRRIRTADVLIFAGTMRHRYLSSVFKAYFDRNFRNGHRPILHGKPMGWLLSGPLRQVENLRQILEAKAEVQRSPRLGIVTDEYGDDEAITARIVEMTRAVDRWNEEPWIRPATFLGVGGRKIFRDLMYTMRGIVRADHKYYSKEGLYDFPQKDLRRTLFNWAMTATMEVPWTRKLVLREMGKLKLAAFRKWVE